MLVCSVINCCAHLLCKLPPLGIAGGCRHTVLQHPQLPQPLIKALTPLADQRVDQRCRHKHGCKEGANKSMQCNADLLAAGSYSLSGCSTKQQQLRHLTPMAGKAPLQQACMQLQAMQILSLHVKNAE